MSSISLYFSKSSTAPFIGPSVSGSLNHRMGGTSKSRLHSPPYSRTQKARIKLSILSLIWFSWSIEKFCPVEARRYLRYHSSSKPKEPFGKRQTVSASNAPPRRSWVWIKWSTFASSYFSLPYFCSQVIIHASLWWAPIELVPYARAMPGAIWQS